MQLLLLWESVELVTENHLLSQPHQPCIRENLLKTLSKFKFVVKKIINVLADFMVVEKSRPGRTGRDGSSPPLPAVRWETAPVVNWVERVSLFCVSFTAWTLSVYSVAGRRPFRSYSTVFPDTIWVTSGSRKKKKKHRREHSIIQTCHYVLNSTLHSVIILLSAGSQVQNSENSELVSAYTSTESELTEKTFL